MHVRRGARPARRSWGRLAQWLEHAVHIRGVTGSNPVSPTKISENESGASAPLSCVSIAARLSASHGEDLAQLGSKRVRLARLAVFATQKAAVTAREGRPG